MRLSRHPLGGRAQYPALESIPAATAQGNEINVMLLGEFYEALSRVANQDFVEANENVVDHSAHLLPIGLRNRGRDTGLVDRLARAQQMPRQIESIRNQRRHHRAAYHSQDQQ